MILATVIDCEGHISVIKGTNKTRRTPVYSVRAGVAMTVPYYVRKLQKEFGGFSYVRKQRSPTAKKWKAQISWNITDQRARTMLLQLAPYLKLKYKQARLALRLTAMRLNAKKKRRVWRAGKALPISIVKKYETIYLKCKELNKRGI